jgi:uncharacterized membrane protein
MQKKNTERVPMTNANNGSIVIDVNAVDSESAQSLKTVGWISYVLHLIVAIGGVVPGGQAGAVLLLIALVIDLVKKDEAQGTWQASHFSWRIRSVLWAGVLYVVTIPLFLLFYVPGAIAWAIISVWFLYRIVRGMVAMNKNRPVGV